MDRASFGDDYIQSLIAICVVLFFPLVLAFILNKRSASSATTQDFLTNQGRNGYVATVAGAIAGNIGIGGFVALFLFTKQGPVIGFSIVAAYTLGLVICATFARQIRTVAKRHGAVGLIDLIVSTHHVKRPVYVWLPLAVVFVLRSAVQLGALGFITSIFFGGHTFVAIIICAVLIGLYLTIGGYKAAVETDIVQALVIVFAVAFCALNIGDLNGTPQRFFSFGEYRPAILVGVWLFIPWSAVLAVDNWQRITLAQSAQVAQRSYLAAAVICGLLFTVMAIAGYYSNDSSGMYETFASLAPNALPWLPAVMFVACIMSSIDTFIMPLISGIGQKLSIARLRVFIGLLVTVTALTAIAFADTLDSVIAAFSSLAVFLPVAFGTLYLKNLYAPAAPWSMNLGLISAIAFTVVDQNWASLVGFSIAFFTYVICLVFCAPKGAITLR